MPDKMKQVKRAIVLLLIAIYAIALFPGLRSIMIDEQRISSLESHHNQCRVKTPAYDR